MRVHVGLVSSPRDPFEAFVATDPTWAPILLDGASGVDGGRYSVFVAGPSRVHRLECDPDRKPGLEGVHDFLDPLRPRTSGLEIVGTLDPALVASLPFIGGWVGALDFEAGHAFTRRAASRWIRGGDELGWFGFYPRGFCRDEERGVTYEFAIEGMAPQRVPDRPVQRLDPCRPRACGAGDDTYRQGVAEVRERIARGEIYQANLCTPYFVGEASRSQAIATARAIRAVGRSPYGAFLNRPDRFVASNSPELLFEVRGDRVRTQPIKGTRPRDLLDVEADASLAVELVTSAKDRAELVMIVDLYRNDLGRIARAGSVKVDGGLRLASFSRVHHLLADVTARLAPGIDAVDVLAVCFPAGSITGAPKRQAIQVIEDLETDPRGIYTGSIGMIDVRGEASFNVAIRTAEWRASRLHLSMGAGIVADSDPATEARELHAKAAAWEVALRSALRDVSIPPRERV